MKRKPTPKTAPRQAKGRVSAKAKRLLGKGASKQRAPISASQPHSKTFGH